MLPNLYLIRVRHTMDDIPLAICATEAEAVEIAKAASWDAPPELLRCNVVPDCSTPCAIDIVEFTDGKPTSARIVRSYEDEPEPA